jgi:hypothetical protein
VVWNRAYHNERLAGFCRESGIPLVDLATVLRDEHFGDEYHPKDEGAQVIAQEVHRGCERSPGLSRRS